MRTETPTAGKMPKGGVSEISANKNDLEQALRLAVLGIFERTFLENVGKGS